MTRELYGGGGLKLIGENLDFLFYQSFLWGCVKERRERDKHKLWVPQLSVASESNNII